MPTQNASYTYKIIKIHSSPKIPKASQISISHFPHITLLFLVTSTCFGRCFHPSSWALDYIYSIW